MNNDGIGFMGLLTIVFIIMKLTGYVAWSWIWVLSPIWISIAAGSAFIIIVFVILFLIEVYRSSE